MSPIQNVSKAVNEPQVYVFEGFDKSEALVDGCTNALNPVGSPEKVEASILILVPELPAAAAFSRASSRIEPSNSDLKAASPGTIHPVLNVSKL